MLEADGHDPNLLLRSGPTPGPASSGGFPSSVNHRGDRKRGPKPHGSTPRGGDATNANQLSPSAYADGGHPHVHSSEFFAQ